MTRVQKFGDRARGSSETTYRSGPAENRYRLLTDRGAEQARPARGARRKQRIRTALLLSEVTFAARAVISTSHGTAHYTRRRRWTTVETAKFRLTRLALLPRPLPPARALAFAAATLVVGGESLAAAAAVAATASSWTD